MKRLVLAVAIASMAVSVHAQLLAPTPHGVVVAYDGRIAIDGRWTGDGVRNATAIVASDERAAVLDALHDEVVIAELDSGRTTRVRTAATPIAAAFVGRELYVLARDARLLQRIGGGADIPLAADPAFLRVANGRLYVYSRATGVVQEIEGDRVVREVTVAPFASDLEIAGTTAYLAYPREAHIRTIDLREMKATGAIAAGGVPVDLAVAGGGTVLTARILAVADPASKRVWLVEATQSTAKAFGRGFLRGLLGLGLFTNRSSEFPTGVDRVMTRGSVTLAYDTTSGTLYRVNGRKASTLATNVAPGAFALTDAGIVWWADGRLRTRR